MRIANRAALPFRLDDSLARATHATLEMEHGEMGMPERPARHGCSPAQTGRLTSWQARTHLAVLRVHFRFSLYATANDRVLFNGVQRCAAALVFARWNESAVTVFSTRVSCRGFA